MSGLSRLISSKLDYFHILSSYFVHARRENPILKDFHTKDFNMRINDEPARIFMFSISIGIFIFLQSGERNEFAAVWATHTGFFCGVSSYALLFTPILLHKAKEVQRVFDVFVPQHERFSFISLCAWFSWKRISCLNVRTRKKPFERLSECSTVERER